MLCSMGVTEDAASERTARPDGSAGHFVKPSWVVGPITRRAEVSGMLSG
jgi:hypothetical protein